MRYASDDERRQARREKCRAYSKSWRDRHREKYLECTKRANAKRKDKVREWNHKNREKNAARMRAYRKRHPDRVAASAAKGRDHRLILCRAWAKKNKEKMRAACAAYYARKRRAMPGWIDRAAIARIYDDCPTGMHVDHIVPIMGENVCGLHVAWNLQYLAPAANISKHNKWPN